MKDTNLKNKNTNDGYKYLLAYKITVPIYDLTTEFCYRYISNFSRTKDQMIQAARSGMQNIAEGNKQQSLAGYIKLCGIARGSLEELLNDYLSFARQNQIEIWNSDKSKRDIWEIRVIWEIIKNNPTLSNSPNFPNLPTSKGHCVNLMITLIHQSNYLIDKLILSLKEKHKTEGGFSEKLLKERLNYKGKTK